MLRAWLATGICAWAMRICYGQLTWLMDWAEPYEEVVRILTESLTEWMERQCEKRKRQASEELFGEGVPDGWENLQN